MKKAITLLLALTSVLAATAQDTATSRTTYVDSAYRKGSYILTLSAGFMNGYRDEYTVPPTFEKGNITGFLPIYARAEYGLTDRWSLAATASYSVLYFNSFALYPSHAGPVRRISRDRFRIFSGGATAYYHLGHVLRIKRLDPFVGVGATISNLRHSALPQGDSTVAQVSHAVMPYLKVGARYYMSDKVSLFADAGYDRLSIFSLGFSCRFAGKGPKE